MRLGWFQKILQRTFQQKYFFISVARVVLVVFATTNIALGHKPLANFWETRASTPPPQTANPSPLIPDVTFPLNKNPNNTSVESDLPASLLSHVTVRSIHKTASPSTIVILEDVHGNPEAQAHIAQAIGVFNDLSGDEPVLIALEGAEGGFLYDVYKKFPNRDFATAAAQAYFQSGEISGPALAGLTLYNKEGTRPLQFWGVDDQALYRLNVAAYKKGSRLQKATQARLSQQKQQLDAQKQRVFSPALKKFDAFVHAYRRGTLPLGSFVRELLRYEREAPLSLMIFSEAYETEQRLNFNQVKQERRRVLSKLMGRLSETEVDSLFDVSSAYQQGRVSFADYYENLKKLCEKFGVDLKQTPAFDQYIQYVLLADQIKPEALLQDLTQTEKKIYHQLASTNAQKDIVAQSRQLYLIEQLSNFSLTSTQWDEYKQVRHSGVGRNPGFKHDSKEKLTAWTPAYAGVTDPFEAFYGAAEKRNHRIVENLHQATKSDWAVLVVGGFHTSGLTQLFKEQGQSYVVVTPRVTQVASHTGSHYLSVFDREKTDLQKIFSGKKLFVVNTPAGPVRPTGVWDPFSEIALTVLAHAQVGAGPSAVQAQTVAQQAMKPAPVIKQVNGSLPSGAHVEMSTPKADVSVFFNTGSRSGSTRTLGQHQVNVQVDSKALQAMAQSRRHPSSLGLLLSFLTGLLLLTVLTFLLRFELNSMASPLLDVRSRPTYWASTSSPVSLGEPVVAAPAADLETLNLILNSLMVFFGSAIVLLILLIIGIYFHRKGYWDSFFSWSERQLDRVGKISVGVYLLMREGLRRLRSVKPKDPDKSAPLPVPEDSASEEPAPEAPSLPKTAEPTPPAVAFPSAPSEPARPRPFSAEVDTEQSPGFFHYAGQYDQTRSPRVDTDTEISGSRVALPDDVDSSVVKAKMNQVLQNLQSQTVPVLLGQEPHQLSLEVGGEPSSDGFFQNSGAIFFKSDAQTEVARVTLRFVGPTIDFVAQEEATPETLHGQWELNVVHQWEHASADFFHILVLRLLFDKELAVDPSSPRPPVKPQQDLSGLVIGVLVLLVGLFLLILLLYILPSIFAVAATEPPMTPALASLNEIPAGALSFQESHVSPSIEGWLDLFSPFVFALVPLSLLGFVLYPYLRTNKKERAPWLTDLDQLEQLGPGVEPYFGTPPSPGLVSPVLPTSDRQKRRFDTQIRLRAARLALQNA